MYYKMRKTYFFLLMLLCTTWSFAQMRVQGVSRPDAKANVSSTGPKVDFEKIAYWVGEGENRAALVIKFNDGSDKAYVWGYKWEETASGEDMFRAIAQDDPRLLLMTQQTNYNGTVCGIGYYPEGQASADITFDLAGAMQDSRVNFRYLSTQPAPSISLGQTSRPGAETAPLAAAAIEEGKRSGIIQHPFDHPHYGYSAYDYDYWKSPADQLWRAAWYDGYWSYWVTENAAEDYTYSGLGYSNRVLQNGCVDGWSYTSDMDNWYSATMEGGSLEYMQPVATAQDKAASHKTPTAIRKANAKVWTVMNVDEFQSAMEEAEEGDTIQFDPSLRGQEVENTLGAKFTNRKSLTLIGNGVILIQNGRGIFTARRDDKTAPTVRIQDFVFKNPKGTTSTYILLQGASAIVDRCVFDGAIKYSAVRIETNGREKEATHLDITNCRFSNNTITDSDPSCIKVSTTPIESDGWVSAKVTSCTFVNNSGNATSVMKIVNNAHAELTNNVFEGNTCTDAAGCTLRLPEEFTKEGITSRGYNVFNGITNETDVNIWEATDAVGTDLAQALTLKDGEYQVVKGGPAYKHLPANTTIEGITLPNEDILGNAIDYNKDAHSGACQKVDGEEEGTDNDYSKGVFFVNEDWYGHQNSTVNFLTDEGEWIYRVVQKENPGMELGCTNQYGQIYGDRFYLVAKQEKDPGASITGGRFTVCDAKTMKIICQLPFIAQNESGTSIADGRGCVGVDENKVYISTSNGIYVFDNNTLQITGKVNGADNPYADPDGSGSNTNPSNPSLYQGQVGSMVRVDDYVFAVHQSSGVLVIDPSIDKVKTVIDFTTMVDEFNKYLDEKSQIGSSSSSLPYPGSAITMSKDGYVWVPVAKGKSGSGATYPFLVRIDPHSLETKVIYIDPAEGVYPPANSWYAWTPDGFCASNTENVLYWNGGANSWFSNFMIFKYDIESGTTTKIIDLDALDDEKWKLYGCSMRPDPVSGDLYMSLFHQFGDPTYITRKVDKDGNKIADYSMIQNYWFPSLPVFPDNEAPVVNAPAPVTFTSDAPVTVSLKDIATDADNFDAAIVKTVKAISNENVIDAVCKNGDLIITPKANGTADITIGINSNGKLNECTLTVTIPEGISVGISQTMAGQNAAKDIYTVDGVRTNRMNKGISIVRMKNGESKKVLVK